MTKVESLLSQQVFVFHTNREHTTESWRSLFLRLLNDIIQEISRFRQIICNNFKTLRHGFELFSPNESYGRR